MSFTNVIVSFGLLVLTPLATIAGEARFSLPSQPAKSLHVEPLAVIPLPGGAPKRSSPGKSGSILAFEIRPPRVRAKRGEEEPKTKDGESGAGVLSLIEPKLTVLPGTNLDRPFDIVTGRLDVSANAHSVYVSDPHKQTVKRFSLSDYKLAAERKFPMEERSMIFHIITSAAATTTPLVLVHPTETQFLSSDRLLKVTPRYGLQAVNSQPPLNNSADFVSDPSGSVFFRGSHFWRYKAGALESRWRPSIIGSQGVRLSYNGALFVTEKGMAATASQEPGYNAIFTPSITRPLCYRSPKKRFDTLGREITVCRNQGATSLLDIKLPDREYEQHYISFSAKRLVAISRDPAEILVYELDLEKVLEGLDAPPWVEVTGPGYVDAGSRATFQMRPVFGGFQSVKLLSPGKLALIKGTKVVLATDSESPTKAQRLVIEFEDKQGRKGTTLWDVNVLGKHKSE